MPLEGHWERVNTPLRATTLRERRIVWVVIGLLAAAAVATVIVVIATSSPSAGAGCIRVDLPSTMGGGTPELCGDSAKSFCNSAVAHRPPLNATALPKCRDAGYE
jgi:hypothetical protein